MKNVKLCALVISLMFFASFNTQAATFNFKYTFTDASALEGMLDGTIQADNDTVLINSFGTVQYAGVIFPTISNSAFQSSPFSAMGSLPSVSFSGNLLDIFVCSGGFYMNGVCDINKPFFILDVNDSGFDGLIFVSTDTVNPPADSYNRDNWSLTQVPTSVPLPAATWLFGSVLLGFTVARARPST